MPGANEKAIEAEKMFNRGMAMAEIAKKLGISAGTVRSWKNRYGWGDKSKKNGQSIATKRATKSAQSATQSATKDSATLQKKKRGAPPGNQNAKGGHGNPHPKHKIAPDAALKHGGYVPVFMDTLDKDEQGLLATIPEDEEQLLLEQIQLFSIRERRIMGAINKYREQAGDVAVSDVIRMEDQRVFKDSAEEAEYDRRRKEKIDRGDILPGKPYKLQTNTTNKDLVIARLEQELSTVQGKKTKAIEALSKLRLEKTKIENENAGNDSVDDWISAVLGEGMGSNE